MDTVVDTNAIVGTINESGLASSTTHIVQQDASTALAKEGISPSNSTYGEFQ